MYISHRKLLRWVTSAQQEKQADQRAVYLKRMWPCLLSGLMLLVFGSIPGKAVGILWILAPLGAHANSRELHGEAHISKSAKGFLLQCGKEIWKYFETYVTAERHWLPPDNVQEIPEEQVAERTSPTNIGLMLLSFLAAVDLGLCDASSAWNTIQRSLQTLAELPKYRGHLYNWTNIRSLKPMEPLYVSTVDSGNLLACLVILRSAARKQAPQLVPLLESLIRNMKLDFLYDEQRALLYIGWEPATDTPTKNWYDLLESEARTASFLAIARGEVPKRHWRHLGRTLLSDNGMNGLASWTGTMFEYLMPELFLAEPKGSLLRESAEFCCRIQYQNGINGLWGISESAYSAQDERMNYKYKAHGVQKLALCVGMEREKVISPYASFLALTMGTYRPVQNLLRLRRMGMEGKFGFYEALDCTPTRVGTDSVRVQSFMVHHLAMSLLAIDNALNAGILCKRFSEDQEMAACQELLEECAPVGQIIRPRMQREAQPRTCHSTPELLNLVQNGMEPLNPLLCPLRSGSFQALVGDTGYHACTWKGIRLHTCSSTPFAEVPGILLFAACGDQLISMQGAPDYNSAVKRSAVTDGASITLYSEQGGIALSQRIIIPENCHGEQRLISLRNRTTTEKTLTVALYLEPVLCRESAYLSHPAFHRLCVEPSMQRGILCFRRRSGGSEPTVAMGVGCNLPFLADTDKALCFGRGGIRNLRHALQESHGIRSASEPCAFLRVKIDLKPGERRQIVFSVSAGHDTETAAAEAEKLLTVQAKNENAYKNAVQRWLKDSSPEQAFSILPRLLAKRSPLGDPLAESDLREVFWRYGLSGDDPIHAIAETEGKRAIQEWAFFRQLGVNYDLVIHTDDNGVYGTPRRKPLQAYIRSLGLWDCENRPAGIHFFPDDRKTWSAFLNIVTGTVILTRKNFPTAGGFYFPAEADTGQPRHVDMQGTTFSVTSAGGTGLRAWCHILTNGSLGWIAGDTGCGCLWLDNAREHRLTPWINDPLAMNPAEELSLLRDGQMLPLFAYPDGSDTRVEYGMGFIRWTRKLPGGTESRVTGFIPMGENQRIMLLELRGLKEGDRVRYRLYLERKLTLSASPGKPLNGSFDSVSLRTGGAVSSSEDCVWAEYQAEPRICLSLNLRQTASLDFAAGERLYLDTAAYWEDKTGVLRLESPCSALNAYLNGWAIYQIMACRLMARNSLYQNGGAYGFRDQLQDVCALADYYPGMTRDHILLCAGHQYEEGDVMHWWHSQAGGDKGVRTRCSDDLLWLVYATVVYLEKTGDVSILQERIPYLQSRPLSVEEADRYEKPHTGTNGTLLEHCQRALEQVMARGTGQHGLLRMGAGDWNDGFDRVRGESVWLTWFAAMVFRRFEPYLPCIQGISEKLVLAAEGAWIDGQYLRGWYEDGTPLGAAGSTECAMDSLAQSFAVLSGLGDPRKSKAAVRKAATLLTDRENGVVRLFTPPFNGIQEPGYIQSYLPGVRENGGQYTHGAVWLAAACLRCGEIELGWQLLSMLLPLNKPEPQYQLEPFVLAADVYDNPHMRGRGGWSWYTGAAGWFLRTAVEELLGIHVQNGRLTVQPRLPQDWNGYHAEIQLNQERYDILVEQKGNKYGISVKNKGKRH